VSNFWKVRPMRLLMGTMMIAIGGGAAMPASAQIWGGPTPASIGASRNGPSIGRELAGIDVEIDAASDSGRLTKDDARALRRERYQLDLLAERYGEDGLSDAEAAELATRARLLHDDAIRPAVSTPATPK
jgi:hypothetical protein